MEVREMNESVSTTTGDLGAGGSSSLLPPVVGRMPVFEIKVEILMRKMDGWVDR